MEALYKLQSAEEIQDALKKIFAPLFEAALKGEMENHLGYPKFHLSIVSTIWCTVCTI